MIKIAKSIVNAWLIILGITMLLSSCNMSDSDSSSKEQAKKPEKKEAVKTIVNQAPQFPGGKAKMFEFIKTNLKYPKEAQENSIEGTVVVDFVVDVDGNLNDIKVIKGIDSDCDAAAVDVVMAMPKWQSAVVNGVAKEVKISLPIDFKLE